MIPAILNTLLHSVTAQSPSQSSTTPSDSEPPTANFTEFPSFDPNSCEDNAQRLVDSSYFNFPNGTNIVVGRPEICVQGSWITICGSYDEKAATVFCTRYQGSNSGMPNKECAHMCTREGQVPLASFKAVT